MQPELGIQDSSTPAHLKLLIEQGLISPPPKDLCPEYLTFSTRDYCRRKLVPGSKRCYWHMETTDKYNEEAVIEYFDKNSTLRDAISKEVAAGKSLEGAYLVSASLGGSFLQAGTNLQGGIFVRANLSDARLSYCNFQSANLTFANLENAYLSDCCIKGALFFGARLFNTKFRNNSFEEVLGISKDSFRGLRWGWLPVWRMLEEHPDQCEGVYRKLVSYWSSQGLPDDASWAAYRACVMRHKLLKQNLSPVKVLVNIVLPASIVPGNKDLESLPTMNALRSVFGQPFTWRMGARWLMNAWAWLRSLLLWGLMGYGERPLRVLGLAAFVILGYAAIYHAAGAIRESTFRAALYFSMITFTTVGYGDIPPRPEFRLLAASEALVGVVLCGLFLFCIGRRSVGRA